MSPAESLHGHRVVYNAEGVDGPPFLGAAVQRPEGFQGRELPSGRRRSGRRTKKTGEVRGSKENVIMARKENGK